MLYLKSFALPSERAEQDYIWYFLPHETSHHPFNAFADKYHDYDEPIVFDFEPLTCLYGQNGSGKSTLLNIIAEKLALVRKSAFNRSAYFDDYLKLCHTEIDDIPDGSQIITSDDVFDFMLDVRHLNQGIDSQRQRLADEFDQYKNLKVRSLSEFESLDLDKYKRIKRTKTKHAYLHEQNTHHIKAQSNGESAFAYFTQKISENALYLLDEPENSLSPNRQLELVQFITDSVRFYGCQFIIATHSPFLLSVPMAKIYDLDGIPSVKKWHELDNMRAYYEFFKQKAQEFES